MSVEGFHARYLPQDFAREITRRPDFGVSTKIQSIAEMYRREGEMGVRDVVKLYEGRDGPLKPEDLIYIMLPEDKYSLGVNLGGIFFGLSLRAVEIALIDRVIDTRDFTSRLKDSLRGGGPWGDGIVVADSAAESVPENYWRAMIDTSKIDKTLGAFFYDGFHLLPPSLKKLMSMRVADQSMLGAMREAIAPHYIARAQTLFARPPQSA